MVASGSAIMSGTAFQEFLYLIDTWDRYLGGRNNRFWNVVGGVSLNISFGVQPLEERT